MNNFKSILSDVIEYSGLINRKDFAVRLIIATLNDLHHSRKWDKDKTESGWSYDEEKAKAALSGECPPEPQTSLTFELGQNTLISVIVCDFEGNTTELSPSSDKDLKTFCKKPDPETGGYTLNQIGGIYEVKGCKPIKTMKVITRNDMNYTAENFDESWIVQKYPNTIIYSVVADILEDTGMHNVKQWLTKANHAIAHMHATEPHEA